VLAKQSEADAEAKTDQGDAIQGDAIKRKARKLATGPAWELADSKTVASLALLLLPAWLLPERSWASLCRARIGLSALTGARAIKGTAKTVSKALDQSDVARSEAIIRGLKAAVYEMRLQDLRGWRPGGWSPQMVLEGEEHLRAALSGGKGAVLWLAPFVFNSGPTKIILHQKGYRVSHLSSPKHGVSETRFGVRYLNRIRCIPEDRYLVDRIVFDSAAPTTAMRRMVRALKAGARAYILKNAAEADLIRAVRAVSEGKSFFSPVISKMLLEDYVRQVSEKEVEDSYDLLTPREREILQLLAEGKTNKEVAVILNLSPHTIDTHRGNLLQKLNLHSVPELILYAVRKGVIQ